MTEAARASDPVLEDDLEAAADATLQAYDGDARAAVKALIELNATLEDRIVRLSDAVSSGFTRGRSTAPIRG